MSRSSETNVFFLLILIIVFNNYTQLVPSLYMFPFPFLICEKRVCCKNLRFLNYFNFKGDDQFQKFPIYICSLCTSRCDCNVVSNTTANTTTFFLMFLFCCCCCFVLLADGHTGIPLRCPYVCHSLCFSRWHTQSLEHSCCVINDLLCNIYFFIYYFDLVYLFRFSNIPANVNVYF